MRVILFNLLLIELVIFIGVFLISFIVNVYKQLIPKSPFEDDNYEDDFYSPKNEEEIFDEGFVEEMNSYDARIADMKESLKTSKYPPVEIITEEYEKELEQ